MRVAVIGVVGLAACGRFGFDEHAHVIADAPAVADAPPVGTDADPSTEIELRFTADIGYVVSVGHAVGPEDNLLARQGGAVNGVDTGDITACPVGLGPELTVFERASQPTANEVLIAAWDDEALERGLVGVIRGQQSGREFPTDEHGWQVCATGDYPGPSGPLSEERFGAGITACNSGMSPSKGWVDANGAVTPGAIGHLVVGPAQSTGKPLGPVCSDPGGVPLEAKWLWYHPTLTDLTAFDATGSNDDRGFLIFKHALP